MISTETFTYDAAGNITGDSDDSCFEYDMYNKLVKYDCKNVSYDLDGNMLSNGSLSCTYDSANRLLTAGGNTYTYNAEDVRIKNVHYGVEEQYTYHTNCKLSKMLTRTVGTTVTKYVYGLGLISEETNNTVKVYHFDYRGSTVAITDVNGNISDTFAYDTYGKITSRVGNSDIIFCYNGRDGVVTDTNGLFYMRARYYSPDMRRFINADIVAGEISEAITLNLYAYANGNPVSNVDPFGLSAYIDAENNSVFLDTIRDFFAPGLVWLLENTKIGRKMDSAIKIFKFLTKYGFLDPLIELGIGAKKDPIDKIYHIDNNYWQQFVGYNNLYDFFFELGVSATGGSAKDIQFDCSVDGVNYKLWGWKGDYLNLGAGAELGIYKESSIPGHYEVDQTLRSKMTLSLYTKTGRQIFTYNPSEKLWWITAFDAKTQNVKAEELISVYTIDLSHRPDIYTAFSTKYKYDKFMKFDSSIIL